MSLGNVIQNHDDGEIDCPGCEEQWGFCSCGGVVHCEYQETFRKEDDKYVPSALLVLECDRCDEYEVE